MPCGSPDGHQVIPQRQVVGRIAQGVDLVAELAGEPGARDIDLLAAEIEETGTKVTHALVDTAGGGRAHDLQGRRSLDLDHSRLRVGDGDVEASAVGEEPVLQRPVGLHVPETVARQPEHDAVHEHAALRRAGEGVAPAPFLQGRHAPREDLVQERRGVGPGHFHRFLGRVEQKGLAPQDPVVPDGVFSVEDREVAAGVDTADQLRTVVAGNEWRFLESPAAEADGVAAVFRFLQVHWFRSRGHAADEPGAPRHASVHASSVSDAQPRYSSVK